MCRYRDLHHCPRLCPGSIRGFELVDACHFNPGGQYAPLCVNAQQVGSRVVPGSRECVGCAQGRVPQWGSQQMVTRTNANHAGPHLNHLWSFGNLGCNTGAYNPTAVPPPPQQPVSGPNVQGMPATTHLRQSQAVMGLTAARFDEPGQQDPTDLLMQSLQASPGEQARMARDDAAVGGMVATNARYLRDSEQVDELEDDLAGVPRR